MANSVLSCGVNKSAVEDLQVQYQRVLQAGQWVIPRSQPLKRNTTSKIFCQLKFVLQVGSREMGLTQELNLILDLFKLVLNIMPWS